MKRAALRALPYLVAFLVPTVVLGVLHAAAGQHSLYGLFGGVVGLLGALLKTATRLLVRRRAQEAELDAVQEWLRAQKRDEPPEHV